MENSAIEWTMHTFNVVWGCAKVSAGCKNCYADTLSHRYGFDVWGVNKPRRTMSADYWAHPYKWDKRAAKVGERHRVFCSSMADVFEDHPTVKEERARLWKVIEETPNLDWLLLTKRPENIAEMVPVAWLESPRPNVWLGTSVENQEMTEKRIPELCAVPATVRFLSCEPLLGPVSFTDGEWWDWRYTYDYYKAAYPHAGPPIHWVIAGGESGHRARPMHPDWARALRDDCQAAGVAFFWKQNGEWLDIAIGSDDWTTDSPDKYKKMGRYVMARVGKKAAGRMLDGRTWDEFPMLQAVGGDK